MDGYEYDVFISYRHKDPVLGWLKNHFHSELEQWLPNCLPIASGCKIFVDWQIETGASWPDVLVDALQKSKCMLAVLTPEYFRSRWCCAEWETMLERERCLGFHQAPRLHGLIYGVTFFDGEHFPQAAQAMQLRDLTEWNYPVPVFRQTSKYLPFITEVQSMARELARMISRAPTWQPDWPIVLGPVGGTPAVPFPRIQ